MTQPVLGVFDSGVGGLTVLNALVAALPFAHVQYLGDTAWMPYGTKPKKALKDRVTHIFAHFAQLDGVVIACNTSAGLFQDGYPRTAPWVLDPATPTAQWLGAQTALTRVGILATPNTVASHIYPRKLAQWAPHCQVQQVASTRLASDVEQQRLNDPQAREDLAHVLAPLLDWGMEALVLGCTHYPLALPLLKNLLPEDVLTVDPAWLMAQVAAQRFGPQPGTGTQEYWVTGNPDGFVQAAQQFALPHLAIQTASVIDFQEPSEKKSILM
jgi:glutamate racemase